MAKITGVDRGGIAESLGIMVGDELLAFDGKPIIDLLDYFYYDSQDSFVMTVSSHGELTDYAIEKDDSEYIGLELDDSVQLEPMRCKNKCKFCFVDQLPKGMRETLYVKDDDYRLSFVSGNFITLTNVRDKELKRIVDLRLSPIYVSVHATDPDIKRHLVANPEGAKTYEKLKYLTEHGIKINTQIVMCPGENDGEVLRQTLTDLAKLRPMVLTCAVVPVGLTGHRQGLYPLTPVDKDKARETIALVSEINKKYGDFVWCSDEFYVKADMELPSYQSYGDFDQIENGVGLIRTFESEVGIGLRYCGYTERKPSHKRAEVTLVTGTSFYKYLREQAERINKCYPKVEIDVIAVRNEFFGESITVAGLLTAGDIIAQCKGNVRDNVVIPSTVLREFTDTFLDGMTVSDVERELSAKIFVCSGGEDLVEIIDRL